jgi:hypothetical protein
MMNLTEILIGERASRHGGHFAALLCLWGIPLEVKHGKRLRGRMLGLVVKHETQHQEQEMNRTKKPLPTKPFFARFLEKQSLESVTGGGPIVTLKFPSDNDEDVTLKFPSDSDETGA